MKKIKKDSNRLILQAKKEGIIRYVAAAIIKRKDKILLLKRKKDDFMGEIYELPSGKVDDNESLLEGLKREIKEETGLETLSVVKHIDTFDYLSKSKKPTRQFNFLITVNQAKPVINLSEHEDYVWVNFNEINELNVTEKVKKILYKFCKQK